MVIKGLINPKDFQAAATHIHDTRLSKPYTHGSDLSQRFLVQLRRTTGGSPIILDSSKIAGAFDPKTGEIDSDRLTKIHDGKYKGWTVEKVKHRPNHGLDHSVGAAMLIPIVTQFRKKYHKNAATRDQIDILIQDKGMERLQMMALFSVSGREDETGFSVTEQGAYKEFRIKSATDYFDYFMNNTEQGLYDLPKDIQKLIHDAVVIEFMGYSSIRSDMLQKKTEGGLGNEDYLGLIDHIEKEYEDKIPSWCEEGESFDDLVKDSVETAKPNQYLTNLNQVHALELLRVYKNQPSTTADGARQRSSRNILPGLMSGCEDECLEDALSILIYARDIIEQRGDRIVTNLSTKFITEIRDDSGKINMEHPLVKNFLEYPDTGKKEDCDFMIQLLSGKARYYRHDYLNNTFYPTRDTTVPDRDVAQDVIATIFDISKTRLPELGCLEAQDSVIERQEQGQDTANEDGTSFIKVIPPYNFDAFLQGQFLGDKSDFRLFPKKSYTLLPEGVSKSIEKDPTLSDKTGYTQHQSVTMITANVTPRVFTVFSPHAVAGVRYGEDAVAVNRMLLRTGTVTRFYDFDTKEDALEKYDKLRQKSKFFKDMNEFKRACEKKGVNLNEVMAYLKWVDESCSVCIFEDNLASRLLAQEYARKIGSYREGPYAEKGGVPISYYIRYSDKNNQIYDVVSQHADIEQAHALYDEPEKRTALLASGDYEFLLTKRNAELILKEHPEVILDLIASNNLFILESILRLANIADVSKIPITMPTDSKNLTASLEHFYDLHCRDLLTDSQKEIFKHLIEIAPKELAQSDLTTPFSHYVSSVFEGQACIDILKDKNILDTTNKLDAHNMNAYRVALRFGHVESYKLLCQEIGKDINFAFGSPYLSKRHFDSEKNGLIGFDDLLVRYASDSALTNILQSSELADNLNVGFTEILSRRGRRIHEHIRLLADCKKDDRLNIEGLLKLFKVTDKLSQIIKDRTAVIKQSIWSKNLHAQIGKRELETFKYLVEHDLIDETLHEQVLGLCLLSGNDEAIQMVCEKYDMAKCIPRLGKTPLFDLYLLAGKESKAASLLKVEGAIEHVKQYAQYYIQLCNISYRDDIIAIPESEIIKKKTKIFIRLIKMLENVGNTDLYLALADSSSNMLLEAFKHVGDPKTELFDRIIEFELKSFQLRKDFVCIKERGEKLIINRMFDVFASYCAARGDKIDAMIHMLEKLQSTGCDLKKYVDVQALAESQVIEGLFNELMKWNGTQHLTADEKDKVKKLASALKSVGIDQYSVYKLNSRIRNSCLSDRIETIKDAGLIDNYDSNGYTLLFGSMIIRNKKLFLAMLENKANVNLPNVLGATPIMFAAVNVAHTGDLEYFTKLMEAGATEPNRCSKMGNNAFHILVKNLKFNEDFEHIKLAITMIDESGVDIFQKNNDELTPLDLVQKLKEFPCKSDLLKLFQSIEAKQSAKTAPLEAEDLISDKPSRSRQQLSTSAKDTSTQHDAGAKKGASPPGRKP